MPGQSRGGAGSGRMWAGVPDELGAWAAPALAGAFYGGEALLLWTTGRAPTGDENADHELLALL